MHELTQMIDQLTLLITVARYWLVTRLNLEPVVGRRRATLAMPLHEECVGNSVIEHGSAINTPRVGDIRRNSFQRTKTVTPTQKILFNFNSIDDNS